MAYAEYITSVEDYQSKPRIAKNLPNSLQNSLMTSLCKEKISIKSFKREMPKNDLEEIIFWHLSLR